MRFPPGLLFESIDSQTDTDGTPQEMGILVHLLPFIEANNIADLIEPTLNPDRFGNDGTGCLLYTSPSPRDQRGSRMPSSA